MPAYAWLFETKAELQPGDVEIRVPDAFARGTEGKIVATPEALQLVAYLQSLKQVPLVDSLAPEFLYPKDEAVARSSTGGNGAPDAEEAGLDGAALYATNCQSCHQAGGEGLKGAFPPLKGSPIVLDDNPQLLIDVVMNGYDAREEYAVMPAVGANNHLKPEEVAAIINHERKSWGNNARQVPVAEVKKIVEFLKNNPNAQSK
jgi:cytochrome c oxidase cbb3-type subunit 2